MSVKSLALTAGLLAALITPAWAETTKSITIEDAYARVSSPNAKVGAIFFEIENTGDVADRLIDAKSEVAARVELHTHKEAEGGVMQMLHVPEGFVVPAEGHHHLKRGGDHVMLMGLHQGLKDGDLVPLTLVFENAGEITLDVAVDLNRAPEAGAHGSHSHSADDHKGHKHD